MILLYTKSFWGLPSSSLSSSSSSSLSYERYFVYPKRTGAVFRLSSHPPASRWWRRWRTAWRWGGRHKAAPEETHIHCLESGLIHKCAPHAVWESFSNIYRYQCMSCLCAFCCVIKFEPWRTEQRSRARCGWFLPASVAWWDELPWTASGNLGWWNYSTEHTGRWKRDRKRTKERRRGAGSGHREDTRGRRGRWVWGWNKRKELLVLEERLQMLFLRNKTNQRNQT